MSDELEKRIAELEGQQQKITGWLFGVDEGDTKSRADLIMATCRDWNKTQDRARFGSRMVVALLGALGGWYAGAGEILAKITKGGW